MQVTYSAECPVCNTLIPIRLNVDKRTPAEVTARCPYCDEDRTWECEEVTIIEFHPKGKARF